MKRTHWLAGSVLTLAVGALASGCVVRARPAPVAVSGGVYVEGSSDYATVYPTSFAPEPIPEYRPAPPGYGYIWVDGYWDWTGYDWTWSSGYWVPERVGYAYIGPRYVYVDGRPVYYRGYWQGNNGYREYGYGGWRGAPPAAWRGSPQTAPQVWRSQPAHTTWRGTPTTSAPRSCRRRLAWRRRDPATGSGGHHAARPARRRPAPAARSAWLARWRRSARSRGASASGRLAGAPAAHAPRSRGACRPLAVGWRGPGPGGSRLRRPRPAPGPGPAPAGWHGADPTPAPAPGMAPPPAGIARRAGARGRARLAWRRPAATRRQVMVERRQATEACLPVSRQRGMPPGRVPPTGPPPGQAGGMGSGHRRRPPRRRVRRRRAPPAMGGGNAYRPPGPAPSGPGPSDGWRPPRPAGPSTASPGGGRPSPSPVRTAPAPSRGNVRK